MPSSFIDSAPPIVKLLIDVNPDRVLDIGPGWGKYGLFLREYCSPSRVDAIEVAEGRKPTQDVIYDSITVSDVRKVQPKIFKNYDLVLMIDIIEHLTVPEGQQIVRNILDARSSLLVSTPKIWDPQEGVDNPYETHVSLWDWTMFPTPAEDISTIDSLIFLITP